MTTRVYLSHYLNTSAGRSKVAEYPCENLADADAREAQIRAAYPNDDASFERREVQHSTRFNPAAL